MYAHMEEVWVQAGQQVNAGDAIGSVGHTGNIITQRYDSNGRKQGFHCHFEICLNAPYGTRARLNPDGPDQRLAALGVPDFQTIVPAGG